MKPRIEPLSQEHLIQVAAFADRQIGTGYYSVESLNEVLAHSQLEGRSCSFVLIQKDIPLEIGALRVSFPPNQWMPLPKSNGIHPDLWKVPINQVGYFKSLFVAANLQGQGWGKKLSLMSMEALKQMGAKAIVCHSWKESPGMASQKYLESLGFESVAEIPNFWSEVDYLCSGCHTKPCICTAVEMIKYL